MYLGIVDHVQPVAVADVVVYGVSLLASRLDNFGCSILFTSVDFQQNVAKVIGFLFLKPSFYMSELQYYFFQ